LGDKSLPGKVTMTITRGMLFTHDQAGGGGHGNKSERDPAAVARDLWNGKITPQYAARHHPSAGL
jgi:N-methylhydantoinase B